MAGRTITQIAGNYGLTQNANKDIFADSEAATLATVNKTLAQLRSNNDEINAAKGFGRSTFGDAITAQQQNDVLNPVFAGFAQARQQEDLNQANFGRQVIAAGVGADITSNAAIQNQALNEKTIGYQTGVQTAAQQTLNAQQGQIQNANTLSQINASQEAQAKINAQQGQIQNTNTADQIRASQEAQAKLAVQAGEIQKSTTAAQISAQTTASSTLEAQRADIAKQSMTQQFEYQKQTINQNFDNQIAALEKQTALQMQSLEPELRLKAEYTKQVLQDQINVQRQTAIENMGFSFLTGIATNLLGPTIADQLSKFTSALPTGILK